MKTTSILLLVFLCFSLACAVSDSSRSSSYASSLSGAGDPSRPFQDPVRIAHYDFRDGETTRVVLIGRSGFEDQEKYQNSSLGVDTKIVEAGVMKQMLQWFEKKSFYSYAIQGAAGDPFQWKGKSRGIITVEKGGTSYVFPHRIRPQGAAAGDETIMEEVQAFIDLKLLIHKVYSETLFPRAYKNISGEYFDRQQKKLLEERKEKK